MAGNVGEAIRRARMERALITQEELARRAGIAASTVNRIERGWQEPHFGTLRKIAAVLGVEPHELVRGGVEDGS
jgi:transcriptional regulator with XRE-family HTH domain